jgi:hypothetical protein
MGVLTYADFIHNQPSLKDAGDQLPASDLIVEKKEEEMGFWILQHPDCTPGNLINCQITIGDEKIEIEYGRVEIRKKSVYQALLGRGYIPCRNYEEN